MAKRICAAKCMVEIKDGEKTIKCVGLCKREYHTKCTDQSIRNLWDKLDASNKTICYRCESCAQIEDKFSHALFDLTNEIRRRDAKINESHKLMMEKIKELESMITASRANADERFEKVCDQIDTVKAVAENAPMQRIDEESWAVVARKQKQKKVKQHPVIIKPINESMKRRDVRQSMNAALDAAEFETNGIDFISKNGIVLRCADEKTQEAIIEKLSTNANDVIATKPKVFLPKVKILRVYDPEDNDDVFIEQIKKQNSEAKFDHCRMLKRENVMKNGSKVENCFNMVIELDNESYETVMNERRIRHQFERYKVVDNIYIRRCYKCFGFNHNASECKNSRACPVCAGDHEKGKCPTKEVKCINCVKKNEYLKLNLDVKHEAWSRTCPSYLNKLSKSKAILKQKI
jgi:hypothetical protein